MTGAPPLRIVLADDERLVRTALRAILGGEPDLVVAGEAASGAEAVSVIRATRPDVALMDVRMPEVDGIRATERVLSVMGAAAPRIVVVTTFENDSYVYDALRAGASGFLLKRSSAEELVQAVRLVARGDSLLFPAAVRSLAVRHAPPYARSAPEEGADGATLRSLLTAREAEVLRLMTEGLSNTEIAAEMAVGPATTKSQVTAVLTKLGARDRTQAVIAAYERGFVTPG
ncbi:response regulator transcription factor [Streptomyces oceani]|uniref:LuxR family transcriptional regulator n=1 Tax=Streptomyces oceani TaxID=1075402 RepID=A0A1E7JYZ0_9ACTN|nr:response regulator transcription factor [Streptomyces oceani]OEU96870.1 LuxR family transcriptional regulator [Streptomyces oceani]